MLEKLLNFILLRKLRAKRIKKEFLNCLESELVEEFLELLLRLMCLIFLLDEDFRRNIKNFRARYLFQNKTGSITVAVIFENNKMKVCERAINDTNITVTFRDSRALVNYLLSPKPDILGSILRQDVTINGNLNHLYKFAYMAKKVQLMVTGGV